jgi:hypothetical protein
VSHAHLSYRERIMEHLVDRFGDIREGENGYTVTWNVVARRPMTKAELNLGNALGLFDVEEEKTARIGYYDCQLKVVCEFFHVLQIGDEPSTELNRMLCDIQRAMRSDIGCGGLSLNIVENNSELDIDGPADRLVAGVVEFQIAYRCALDDPREP